MNRIAFTVPKAGSKGGSYGMWKEKTLRIGGIPRTCKFCGKEFACLPLYARRGKGEFCSRTCSSRFRAIGLRLDKECENCGKTFWTHRCKSERHRFCSRRCSKVSKNIRTCKACGSFAVKPSSSYCSDKCRASLRPKPVRVKMNCLHCGKEYETIPTARKKGQGVYCSRKCFSADIIRSGHLQSRGFSNGKGGKRKDLENRYFRSRWEANYARYLNWMKERGELISWQYEPKTFEFPVRRGSKFYTPDFLLNFPNGSAEYHEVKGYMDQTSKTKLKRMAKYYPEEKVVIIDHPVYRQIHKQLSSLIPGWEKAESKHAY